MCPEGTITCEGATAQVCDGLGGFKSEEACAKGCLPGTGCLICTPGAVSCAGSDVLVCNEQGSGTEVKESCDSLMALACDAQQGSCVGACAGITPGSAGCDFYPTVLQQNDSVSNSPGLNFAVTIANASGQEATVTVTQGDAMVATTMVPSGTVRVLKLPWVQALTKGMGPSVMVTDGAYHLRSTRPVTVHQMSPYEAHSSNDASLLLPVHIWSKAHVVASWPHDLKGFVGFYAVVASHDDTSVTLVPSKTGQDLQAGGGVAANGSGVVVLDAGDVLQVVTKGGDVTGTLVQADRPVQVFGGHECSRVPTGCDHLEEAILPIDLLAQAYVVTPPARYPNSGLEKEQFIRVIASEAGTTLTFTPDQPVGKFLAEAGDFIELGPNSLRFVVTADKKILVAQYMVGYSPDVGIGDPAMLITSDPLTWRKSYLFHAATSWDANYVNIVAPKNAAVKVDGGNVVGWSPVAASNYQVAHVTLKNAGDGTHTVTSDVGVGIDVLGIQFQGSTWYSGGFEIP